MVSKHLFCQQLTFTIYSSQFNKMFTTNMEAPVHAHVEAPSVEGPDFNQFLHSLLKQIYPVSTTAKRHSIGAQYLTEQKIGYTFQVYLEMISQELALHSDLILDNLNQIYRIIFIENPEHGFRYIYFNFSKALVVAEDEETRRRANFHHYLNYAQSFEQLPTIPGEFKLDDYLLSILDLALRYNKNIVLQRATCKILEKIVDTESMRHVMNFETMRIRAIQWIQSYNIFIQSKMAGDARSCEDAQRIFRIVVNQKLYPPIKWMQMTVTTAIIHRGEHWNNFVEHTIRSLPDWLTINCWCPTPEQKTSQQLRKGFDLFQLFLNSGGIKYLTKMWTMIDQKKQRGEMLTSQNGLFEMTMELSYLSDCSRLLLKSPDFVLAVRKTLQRGVAVASADPHHFDDLTQMVTSLFALMSGDRKSIGWLRVGGPFPLEELMAGIRFYQRVSHDQKVSFQKIMSSSTGLAHLAIFNRFLKVHDKNSVGSLYKLAKLIRQLSCQPERSTCQML